MKKHKTILDEVHPDLLQPPHSFDWLMHMVLDTWQSDPSQLTEHLAACEYCRTASIVLLTIESKYEQSNETADADLSHLWEQFVKIHQALQAVGHEKMNEYAEAIAVAGKEEADKRFPHIEEHISLCHKCDNTLKDILDFIKLSEGIE
jgi:hypothetical protein